MKRLIYSPSINVWIKTDTGIFDLSPYITNCTVDRRVNSVSFAQLEFRNPKITDSKTKKSRFMFTEHVRDDGSIHPMFHPMDPIIITMTRLRGRPIQVFTGFCDTAPYVQVYPGTAKIEASCTLKRLQYTYWDPALPFVQAFMTAHGWGVDVKTGTALNPNAEGKNTGTLNDTSIGSLLYTILKEVGGWDPSNIYIQELPGDKIGKLVAKLYQDTSREEASSIKDFHKFLRDIIGASAYGTYGSGGTGGGGTGGGGDDGGATVTMVGDSITNMSQTELKSAMPGITIYAHDSKHMDMNSSTGGDSGTKILNDRKSSLGGIVIVALGTNDEDSSKSSFLSYIDKAMTSIGSNKKAVFVTVTTNNHVNEAIREAHSKYSNLSIADWASKAEIDPNNQPHPTTHGKLVFAKTIADVVNSLAPAVSSTPTASSRRLPNTWNAPANAYSGNSYPGGVDHLNSLLQNAPMHGHIPNDRNMVAEAARNGHVPFALLWATYGAESSWGSASSWFGLTADHPGTGTSGDFKADAKRSAEIWLRLYKESNNNQNPSY